MPSSFLTSLPSLLNDFETALRIVGYAYGKPKNIFGCPMIIDSYPQ